ncbi:MAG: hypothetical protein WBZ37_14025 [Mycobacterium sp.]
MLTLARVERQIGPRAGPPLATHWRTIRRILAAVDASIGDFANEIDAAERSRRRS